MSVLKDNQFSGHPTATVTSMFAGKSPIIPFLTAGFPTDRVFLDAARAVWQAGAGALEIGMPFSDPLADGPAIQQSSQVALARGVTIRRVLELAAKVRRVAPVPIFLMGYLNPILRMGLDRFASEAQSAGVAGTIIPDCPIDEAALWVMASRRHGLVNIFLIAPTTPTVRIRQIDRASTVFSYCVSVAGVTGVRSGVAGSTKGFLRRVKRTAKKPFVVGFGIGKPDHVRALRGCADGYVVGSALVPLLEDGRGGSPAGKVGRAIASLVRAAN